MDWPGSVLGYRDKAIKALGGTGELAVFSAFQGNLLGPAHYGNQAAEHLIDGLRVTKNFCDVRVKQNEVRAFCRRLVVPAWNAAQGISLGSQVTVADETIWGSHRISLLNAAPPDAPAPALRSLRWA